MRNRFRGLMVVAALAAAVVISVSVTGTAGQASRSARTVDDKPNFSGIWQANNEAHWDLQAHAARPGMSYAIGGLSLLLRDGAGGTGRGTRRRAGVPGSIGVVQGDGRSPTHRRPRRSSRRTLNTGLTATRNSSVTCRGFHAPCTCPIPFRLCRVRTRSIWHTRLRRLAPSTWTQSGTARRYRKWGIRRPLGSPTRWWSRCRTSTARTCSTGRGISR